MNIMDMMNRNGHSFGYRFHPKDEELVRDYLFKRISGLPLSRNPCLVYDMDVYAREPWLLPWPRNPFLEANERYFFVKRKRMSKDDNGKRPRRNLGGEEIGGWWKANTGDKDIVDEQGCLLGHMKSLTFYIYTSKQRNRQEAIKTDWIMHEYRLRNDNNAFQEWVLCRIKYNGQLQKVEANNGNEATEETGQLENFEANNGTESMEEIGQYLEQQYPADYLASTIEQPSNGSLDMHVEVATENNLGQQQQQSYISWEGCNNTNINGTLFGDLQDLTRRFP